MSRRYSMEPLAAASGVPLPSLGRVLGVSGSTWQDARKHGVGERAADRYAVRLGLHVANVWPEMVDHAIEDASVPCEECGEPLLPTRAGHTFHGPCYARRASREWKRRKHASDETWRAAERERSRAYRQSAGRAIALKQAAYKAANAERLRERKRQWYLENRDVILAKQRDRDRAKRGQREVAA